MTVMMIGLAMIESLAIYALVVCLIILYADPSRLSPSLPRLLPGNFLSYHLQTERAPDDFQAPFFTLSLYSRNCFNPKPGKSS